MEIKDGQKWIRKVKGIYDKCLYIESVGKLENITVRIGTKYGGFTSISRSYLCKNYELDTVYESTRQFDQDLKELLNET